MKKSIIWFLTILTLFTTLISGCTSETVKTNNGLSFDYENDFQYYYNSLNGFNYPITKSDSGYYAFLPNRFLYYIDKELNEALPLCNKPNCTHETDDCNAYFNLYEEPSSNTCNVLQYNKGYLYIVLKNQDGNGEFKGSSLYRVSKDGNQREKLLDFNEGISYWLIHRGCFYYASVKYSDDAFDFSVFDSYSIKKLSIDDINTKAETVFNSKKYCDYLQGVNQFSAYGDYIFTVLNPISEKDIQEINNDGNYVSDNKSKIFSINTETLKANEICSDEGAINPPTIYKGKLLYSIINNNQNKKDKYYTCDLDGKNHKLKKEVKYGDNLFCNETDLYSVNYLESLKEKEHFQKVSVLDNNFNEVNSFRIPIENLYIMNIPQDEEFFIFIHMGSNNSATIYSIEKGKLNSSKDKNMEYKILNTTDDSSK